MMIDTNEPTLAKMDDYNGNESPEKRATIYKVIALCLVVGAIFAVLKIVNNDPGDYVGTPQNPGINTTR